MPRVNIYIRKDDEEKWKAIGNKPEWLHEHLRSNLFGIGVQVNSFSTHSRLDTGSCPSHGTELGTNGKCLQKGCKYGK